MFIRWLMFFCCILSASELVGQSQSPESVVELPNRGMEEWNAEGAPTGWNFIGRGGGEIAIESDNVNSGESAAQIDSTNAEGPVADLFSNLMASIDAAPFRGKKVRYSAAVRTDELDRSARVQMWLRVDRPADSDGQRRVGAFDNMKDRTIRTANWERFEIVLPVADDAEKLAMGIFITGKGKAWFDDASLEIVDDATPSTAMMTDVGRAPSIPPAVARALSEAAQAPRQPFYSHWLWLALLAIILSFVAMLPLRANDRVEGIASSGGNRIRGYSLRSAALYWFLYCLPNVVGIIPWIGPRVASAYNAANTWIVTWMARDLFHHNRELIPPNGSGDTTYNYLSILALFAIAALGGLLWFVLDRRGAARDWAIQDLLRSYLRYSIALSMIGYGLAKVSLEMNQFPENTSYQLDKTWGDSSPMNVLWAFLGASRPYTIFAGLGEVLAALLIVWRRTAVLGAIVSLGVMTNVMMLNYCYDVPVKIYSTHLVVMSLMVLLPDATRLINFFLLNRATAPAGLLGFWRGQRPWMRWIGKLAVIGYCIFLPLTMQGWALSRQVADRATREPQPKSNYLLIDRGYRWINEVPFNR